MSGGIKFKKPSSRRILSQVEDSVVLKVCNLEVWIFSNPLKKYKGAYNRFALLKKYKGVRLPQSGSNSSGHRLADDALLHVTSLLEQARRQEKHAVLISLDISGAFDSLQYPSIRDRFSSLPLFSNISETLLDTLRNRKVAMQTSEEPVLWEQTQGCPQGSCSGPAFWTSWQTKSYWYSGLKEFIYKHLPMILRS
ncbi:hypothetical protein AVEN_168865-1 [Araneus ventricosus]|uniref:Uncharacterized protein n=1 Tax=Araneus ventricosus TaxID=182803 RepID=A0A4Y2L029_ARAVE|nr:hypothetical protein AVEN_168865-1 [Araneus ventricosus]